MMQKKGINNYWREFLVREAIEAINIGHVENGGDELTVSECRKLRNEIFDKAFTEKANSGDQPIAPAKLMEIMDNIAEEKYNTYVFGDDKSTSNEFYQDCINEFMDLTGATTKCSFSKVSVSLTSIFVPNNLALICPLFWSATTS